MSQWQRIKTAEEYEIPLQWLPRQEGKNRVVLILPALGTPAKFYETFMKTLSERGYSTALLEYRGLGESSLRASGKSDWGFKDYLHDIERVLDWLKERVPDKKILLAGHSLGGLLSATSTALFSEKYQGFVLLGCGSPYYRNYRKTFKIQLFLARFLFPLLYSIYGYFPGKKVGFGGNEAVSLIKDWLQLAKYNRFQFEGLKKNLEEKMAAYSGPVLSLSFDRDVMVPRKAALAVIEKLKSAKLTHRELGDEDLGCSSGHYEWAKHPGRICDVMDEWIGNLEE